LLGADEEAQFFDFHAKTSAPLFRKAYRMCRGHEADARDALQRAYLKALDNWASVGTLADSPRYAWLARTLTNEVLQIWRMPYRSREAGAYDDAGEVPGTANVPDSAQHRDELRRACRAIAQIEGRPGEVIALHCLGGYEIAEVAEMLGVTTATVRVHLHTARERLKAIMGGEEDADHDDP
jgi:RNA polymerase sigma factor (sigma-70 family)